MQNMNAHNAVFSSPLPGKIVKILACEGEFVERGQDIFVIESMKMLHTLHADRQGYMHTVHVKEGDLVQAHYQLARLR
jgi:biotin carboxyl carrier protein